MGKEMLLGNGTFKSSSGMATYRSSAIAMLLMTRCTLCCSTHMLSPAGTLICTNL